MNAPDNFKDLRDYEKRAIMEMATMPEDQRARIVALSKMDDDLFDCLVQTAKNHRTVRDVCSRLLHWKTLGLATAGLILWFTGTLKAIVGFLVANPAAAATASAAAAIIGWESLT